MKNRKELIDAIKTEMNKMDELVEVTPEQVRIHWNRLKGLLESTITGPTDFSENKYQN